MAKQQHPPPKPQGHGQQSHAAQGAHGHDARPQRLACRAALDGLNRSELSNAALLLQRYLPTWATGDEGDTTAKPELLRQAIQSAKRVTRSAEYASAFDRWKHSLEKFGSGITHVSEVITRGRLIVGLGTENVLETGITLNHLYGLPIIPGSSLKGLAAHYCNQVWGNAERKFKKPSDQDDEQYREFLAGQRKDPPADNFHRLLFGTTDDSGCIVFHDAWWVPGSSGNAGPLVRDVMTPHHPKWLDGSVPPSDFDSPTPVPFLSVTGKFLLAVSWNGPHETDLDRDEASRWTKLAMELLQAALSDWGVGGKTSSGYGRLSGAPAGNTNGGTVPPLQPGQRVKCKLLQQKTKSGSWKAVVLGDGRHGAVQGSKNAPTSWHPDMTIELIIVQVKKDEVDLKWDPP